VTSLVLALTGTDHHPFDRLVRWIDAAATRHDDVRFVLQHGATRPPLVAEGHAFLGHDRLTALLGQASVVVCHGGPGTIMDAREAGHVPLCVPRDPALGEHVDGHQQRFAALVGRVGVVREITSSEMFHDALASALAHSSTTGAGTPVSESRDVARALAAAELDEVMTVVRPHRLRWQRRAHA
jgi:UDP-N-acetylglucosamine transferase subunit ALG13